MPCVTIKNLTSKSIECSDKSETLLKILLQHTDWMHACGGKGRCTTCKAVVLEGMENLTQPTEAEQKFRRMDKLQSNERLCCQVQVSGDITMEVADEYKLPHLRYDY